MPLDFSIQEIDSRRTKKRNALQEWRQRNPDKAKLYRLRYREKSIARYRANPSRYAAQQKAYREANREKIKERDKNYRTGNHAAVSAGKMKWARNNRDRVRSIHRAWESRDRGAYRRALYRSNVAYNLGRKVSRAIRSMLNRANLTKSGRTWGVILGYSKQELKDRLESLFSPGMSWELVLSGDIHIDHVIPVSKFRYSSVHDIEFKRCWALENLQPLWASQNISKGNRIDHPVQIALGV